MSHTHLIALHKSCHRTQPLVFTDTECTRVATCAGAYMRTHTATCSHTCMCAHTLYEKESNNGNDHPDVHPGGWIYTAVVWDFWEWNKQQRESHTGANEMAETHSSEAEGRKPGSPVFARNAQRPGNWPGQTEKLDSLQGHSHRPSMRVPWGISCRAALNNLCPMELLHLALGHKGWVQGSKDCSAQFTGG